MKLLKFHSPALRFTNIGAVSLIALTLAFLGILSGCSREKAVENLMADPQMSQLILDRIWQTPQTKDTLVQMVMNDPESMKKILESVVQDSIQAAAMMDRLMENEELQDMLKEKTADLHKTRRR
ncbi:MAG: hypothetical protein AMJ73_08165 [candidate division Zixibacteria bacterium SM1_73]|nr:MAG: hypothetical protein AMJ73_08165 [candidate division Zixibacteria bacterium SM1_73]